MRQLESYRWPGNVRELMNVIERSVLLSQDGVLQLPETLAASDERSPRLAEAGNPALIATLEEVERSHIESVVAACDGQISGRGGAAQILGIHPNTLRSRMKKLGIGPRPENNSGPL
jgi:DNA-binding NtrC family response regulator